jgi:serine/threonine protein kinase
VGCGQAAWPSKEGHAECVYCGALVRLGTYPLIQVLEEGPEGMVYRARDPQSDRPVLVRLMPENFGVSPSALVSAARLASTLVHPHIATVYDAGEYRGRAYVVLQDVAGVPVLEADLTVREAVAVIRDAALALEHAHGRRFVHAELRPSCLRLSKGGSTYGDEPSRRVYVTGLGLGNAPNGIRSETRADAWVISPEERSGGRPDARSNVYALGAILYALAAGAPPRPEPGGPPPPSRANPLVDSGLETVILKAMAAEPDARYASAGFFAEALTRWLDGEASTLKVRPAAETVKAPPPAARKPTGAYPRKAWVAAGAAIGVVLLVVVAIVAWRGGDPPAPPTVKAGPVPEPPPPPAPPAPVVPVPPPPPPTPPPPDPKPEPPQPPEPPEVAFLVTTDPEGARVLVDGRLLGPAPVSVYRRDLKDGSARIQAEFDGYGKWDRTAPVPELTEKLHLVLSPLPARIRVVGSPPRATFHVFAVPDGVRNPRALTALWSLEPSELRRGLEALDPQDAGHALERLRVLSGHSEEAIRARAALLVRVPPAPLSVRLEKAAETDAAGAAELDGLPSAAGYVLHGTAKGRRDYCSNAMRLGPGRTQQIRAELPEIPPPPPTPVVVAPPPPKPAPKPEPKPEPKPQPPKPPTPVPASSDLPEKIGAVVARTTLGTIVRLEAGVALKAGDLLEALHDGKVAAELVVEFVAKPDALYPHGSVACRESAGKPSPGNLVRRKK